MRWNKKKNQAIFWRLGPEFRVLARSLVRHDNFDWSHGGEVSCFRDSRPWHVTGASWRPRHPRIPRLCVQDVQEPARYRRDACLDVDDDFRPIRMQPGPRHRFINKWFIARPLVSLLVAVWGRFDAWGSRVLQRSSQLGLPLETCQDFRWTRIGWLKVRRRRFLGFGRGSGEESRSKMIYAL